MDNITYDEDINEQVERSYPIKKTIEKLSAICLKKSLNINHKFIDYIVEYKESIDYFKFIKDHIKILIYRGLREFIYSAIKLQFGNDVYIFGEYIKSCFTRETDYCDNIGIYFNQDSDVCEYKIISFFKQFFDVDNISGLLFYSDSDSDYDTDSDYQSEEELDVNIIPHLEFDIYPQSNNTDILLFLKSKEYLQNIFMVQKYLNWDIDKLLDEMKLKIYIRNEKHNYNYGFDIDCLYFYTPKQNYDEDKNICLDCVKFPNKDFEILNNYPESLNYNNNNYSSPMIITYNTNIKTDSIINNIKHKQFIILDSNGKNNLEHYNWDFCVLKNTEYSDELIIRYYNLIGKGWTCLNKKCNNNNCIFNAIKLKI
ncbi:hypothetical protein [Saudi moumouvirus]|nr:hypothetical protein [Saudi moumouvirus]